MQSLTSLGDLSPDKFMEKALDLTDSTIPDVLHMMTFIGDDDDPDRPRDLNSMGDVFWQRYEAGYRASDLDKAISSYNRSVRLTPDFDPEQGIRLVNLGLALRTRFENTGDVSDIDTSCFCFEGSLLNEPRGERACSWMGNLGGALMERLAHTGDVSELTPALKILQQAAELMPDGHPDKPSYLNNLGNAFRMRFDRLGDVFDLEAAISAERQTVELTPYGHPGEPVYLNNLGLALERRFDLFGEVSDLEMAVSVKQQAVELTPEGHPNKPSRLNNLGSALETRFNRFGDVSDLQSAVSVKRQAVELTPNEHPSKPSYLDSLGNALEARFDSFGDVSDLEMAVSVKQQAVELSPDDHPGKPAFLNNLGLALDRRFNRFGDISDLEMAATVKRQAAELTSDGHPDKPGRSTNLGNALDTRFDRFGDVLDLEMAVSVKQQAVELIPDGHPDKPSCLNDLGVALNKRFHRLGDVSDLETAVSIQRQAVELTSNEQPSKPAFLNNLGLALEARFHRLGDVSDLEMAISIKRQAVELTPDGHTDKPGYFNNFGSALETRFDRLGDVSDLEMAVSVKRQAVELTPDEHPFKPRRLSNLGNTFERRFDCLGDVSDLEMAVFFKRQAVELTPDDHPDKPGCLNNFGNAVQMRFNLLGDVSDLQSAIAAMKRSVDSTPDGHFDKPSHLTNLTRALMQKYENHGSTSDLEAALHSISTAAQSTTGLPRTQFEAARRWSELSDMVNDEQQTLQAYDCAINLIQRVAWMGLEIEGRHRELEQIGELVRHAAAAAVRYGDPERALQWLEQGRSVVWGQSLQQRSPLDLLREHDSIRADRLTDISRSIEFNAKDTVLSAAMRGERLRALVLEWDALVLEIKKLEGFEDFLGPKKIGQLLTAASSCPVIVLNTHKAGCDALVLMEEADTVIHVPLGLNSGRALELFNTLETIKSRHSRGRNTGPGDRGFRVVGSKSYDPEKMIKGLLAELWTSVVKPVLDGLAFSLPGNDGDDLPRVCWCPTGLVAFLPIHAAGLYDTDERGTKVFEFVVSSYTPTVSALLQASSPNPTVPKIFAVAQAQQTNRGFSILPSTSKEVRLVGKRAAANSIDFVVAEDGAGTVQRVLDEMAKCSWIHLACHGTQDLDDPTKSAFILADGDLELSEIIKHPLPHAEFAFLSACQTATGDAKLAEEAVHLAAGMMLAGYRSVIATMWSILDKDGPDVADDVYAEMLKDGKADYTRAAYALHRAVQKLRLSGAPFMAWMPFIHMGK